MDGHPVPVVFATSGRNSSTGAADTSSNVASSLKNALAYNFSQIERTRRHPTLTFPQLRAIIQESFTAYLFAQQPRYLRRIEALKDVQPRI